MCSNLSAALDTAYTGLCVFSDDGACPEVGAACWVNPRKGRTKSYVDLHALSHFRCLGVVHAAYYATVQDEIHLT